MVKGYGGSRFNSQLGQKVGGGGGGGGGGRQKRNIYLSNSFHFP